MTDLIFEIIREEILMKENEAVEEQKKNLHQRGKSVTTRESGKLSMEGGSGKM